MALHALTHGFCYVFFNLFFFFSRSTFFRFILHAWTICANGAAVTYPREIKIIITRARPYYVYRRVHVQVHMRTTRCVYIGRCGKNNVRVGPTRARDAVEINRRPGSIRVVHVPQAYKVAATLRSVPLQGFAAVFQVGWGAKYRKRKKI
jgi:hypothetical protein